MPQDIDETLKALHAYIEKYKNTGRAEVYRAYLDIAHIHHGLWACITFHDHIDVAIFGPFGTGDPEKDAELAEAHKAEAMTYYRKYHLNPHKLPDDDSYERLKKEEASGWEFILFGC